MKAIEKFVENFYVLAVAVCILASGCSQDSSTNSIVPDSKYYKLKGVVNGGGGKGVLCGSHLQTLDLYEAKIKSYSPPKSYGSLKENVKKYGLDMWRHFAYSVDGKSNPNNDELWDYLEKEIIQRFYDIPSDQELPLTNDATISYLEDQCSVVQIAVYSEDGVIYRDLNLWNLLNIEEQTALILHEWIYHRARAYGVKESDETRMLIAELLSAKNPSPILEPIWTAPRKLWCGFGTPKTENEIFEIYGVDETRMGQTGLAFYFHALKDVYVTSRTEAFLPAMSIDKFFTQSFYHIGAQVSNLVTGKTLRLELKQSSSRPSNWQIRAYENGGIIPSFSNGFCTVE